MSRPASAGTGIIPSNRLAPSDGVNVPSASCALLREVRREAHSDALGIGDVQRAGRVGAAEPLLARDGVVVRRHLDRDRADRLRTVDEQRHVGLPLQLGDRQ